MKKKINKESHWWKIHEKMFGLLKIKHSPFPQLDFFKIMPRNIIMYILVWMSGHEYKILKHLVLVNYNIISFIWFLKVHL